MRRAMPGASNLCFEHRNISLEFHFHLEFKTNPNSVQNKISEQDGVAVVEREQCIGCGLCVTGCPNDAAKLQQKPDAEIVHPAVDYAAVKAGFVSSENATYIGQKELLQRIQSDTFEDGRPLSRWRLEGVI